MDQEVGKRSFFQSSVKRLDKLVRELSDEPDRISEQQRLLVR